jgi:hypothetical protein
MMPTSPATSITSATEAERANRNDAAPEAGTLSTEPAIGLANLYGSAIDFCFMPPGATDWVGPVFGAEGGVPNGAVTVKRPVPIVARAHPWPVRSFLLNRIAASICRSTFST